MFNLFKKEKEFMISRVEGIEFIRVVSPTQSNLEKFEYLQSLMSNLPQVVKDKMKEKELIVRFIEEDEFDEVLEGYELTEVERDNILGLYSSSLFEEIHIKCNQSYEKLQNTFFHEVGHFVDRFIGEKIGAEFLSLIETDFQEIAIEESDAFEFDYYKQDIKEYFAQSFAEFVKQSDTLDKMPTTHMYMYSYVDSLEVI